MRLSHESIAGGEKKIRYNIFEDSNWKEIKENILRFTIELEVFK